MLLHPQLWACWTRLLPGTTLTIWQSIQEMQLYISFPHWAAQPPPSTSGAVCMPCTIQCVNLVLGYCFQIVKKNKPWYNTSSVLKPAVSLPTQIQDMVCLLVGVACFSPFFFLSDCVRGTGSCIQCISPFSRACHPTMSCLTRCIFAARAAW